MKSNTTRTILLGLATVTTLVALYGLNKPTATGVNFLSAQPTEVESAFIQFIVKYGKTYASKDEFPERFELFKKTYDMVQAHNSKEGVTSKLSINKFADMKREEVTGGAALPDEYHTIEKANINNFKDIMNITLTKEVDWSMTDKDGPVRDQGNCQACWAFSAASTLGSALSILHNQPIEENDVSVQYLVDCNMYNSGCAQGSMWNAYRWILKKGYVNWHEYSTEYIDMQRTCKMP